MTALGINITDRDHIYGWESIQPRKISNAEARYREALEDEQRICREHNKNVDHWVDHKQYSEMMESGVRCEEARERTHRLYVQWNCPHIHQEYGGSGMTMANGSPEDSTVLYCVDCGAAMDEPVDTTIPTEEIPF